MDTQKRTHIGLAAFIVIVVALIAFSGQIESDFLKASLEKSTAALERMLLPLVAVGILTAALVEVFKAIVRPRSWYHRKKVREWLQQDDRSYKVLVDLATAGDEPTLMLLPTDQLMGQINSAVQIALQDPQRPGFQELIRRVSSVANQAQVDVLFSDAPDETKARVVPKILPFIQRKLDGLQLSIESRWGGYLQILSILISMGIILLSLGNAENRLELIGFALVGGMIAPIARDIVAAIGKARAAIK